MVWPIIDEGAVAPHSRRTAAASQRGGLRKGGFLAKEVFILINLTLGYNLIREGREQGSKPPGPQERQCPHPEVGQEGIRAQDAGMGQARRQAKGKRESKTEGEVNCGYLQAWGSVLVQVYVAGPYGAGVREAGK